MSGAGKPTNATVAEMDAQGRHTILLKGTNEWVCFPGNENVIGDVPMTTFVVRPGMATNIAPVTVSFVH